MHTWILAAALATSVLAPAPARAGCLPVVRDAWLRLPPQRRRLRRPAMARKGAIDAMGNSERMEWITALIAPR